MLSSEDDYFGRLIQLSLLPVLIESSFNDLLDREAHERKLRGQKSF